MGGRCIAARELAGHGRGFGAANGTLPQEPPAPTGDRVAIIVGYGFAAIAAAVIRQIHNYGLQFLALLKRSQP
ncbi:hypothetical protein [Nodosilinea sp. LEGE 07298]|uniref:hypothetical protein n=1 Tax=Nodosilinea sp. LEGE 07298 TaxID=2777970 RepID=UPI001D135FDC|nr:hypothetical protein [Nodosilinea sp. LEGE 07298]